MPDATKLRLEEFIEEVKDVSDIPFLDEADTLDKLRSEEICRRLVMDGILPVPLDLPIMMVTAKMTLAREDPSL